MLKNKMDKSFNPKNSSMARNFTEITQLGKQMENLPTNTEVKEDGKIPDPIQEKEKVIENKY
ncbi:hypothetical protein M3182_12935 [Mesobacillus maritimus]|uniref:hypothetical protein n=1 Tax=Mesobacillus maritimus TaxID=1643336 RepID=UPI00203DEC8C|nr:hypothetical protein [Mesobacillus maritimus]MCM3586637.1 hypothetical protein [Mesobacillus maritimus]MCM3668610.1 hypothetical protein [Mesobacillus maritimus]